MESLKKLVITYGKYIQNLQVFKVNKRYPSNIQSVSKFKEFNPTFNVKTSCMNVLKLHSWKYLRICWRLCFLGSCVFFIQSYIVCIWMIEGQSNEPTFNDGDIILVGNVRIIYLPIGGVGRFPDI